MSSDISGFFRVLFHLLRDLRENLGGAAFVAPGVFLLGGVVAGGLVLNWLRKGGWSRSARHFLAERWMVQHYLQER